MKCYSSWNWLFLAMVCRLKLVFTFLRTVFSHAWQRHLKPTRSSFLPTPSLSLNKNEYDECNVNTKLLYTSSPCPLLKNCSLWISTSTEQLGMKLCIMYSETREHHQHGDYSTSSTTILPDNRLPSLLARLVLHSGVSGRNTVTDLLEAPCQCSEKGGRVNMAWSGGRAFHVFPLVSCHTIMVEWWDAIHCWLRFC